MKMETKEKLVEIGLSFLKGVGIGAVGGLGLYLGYRMGLKQGEDRLVELLIHQCGDGIHENEYISKPVYTSSDPAYGDLMFELSAECIGD